MATVCKTRLSAKRQQREKPHYYLVVSDTNMFSVACRDEVDTIEADDLICDFEDRIDWSTWGPSR